MFYYKTENLHKKCKTCKKKQRNIVTLGCCDIFLYTKEFPQNQIMEFFHSIQECFNYECLDKNLIEKEIKLNENINLYKITEIKKNP